MKLNRVSVVALIVWLACSTIAVAGAKSRRDCRKQGDSFSGVAWQVCEQAHDGTYSVLSNTTTLVDQNSDLHLTFDTGSGESAPPSEEWLAVNKALQSCVLLQEKRLELNTAQIDITDTVALAQFMTQVRAFNRAASQWLDDTQSLFTMPANEWAQVLLGDDPGQPYANIATFLSRQLSKLNKDAQELQSQGENLQLTVVAYHTPQKGKTLYLHVDGYNTIEEGELRPAPSTGLALNPDEAELLRMSLKMSEQAVASIQEIHDNQEAIEDDFRKAFDEIRSGLDQFEIWVSRTVQPWIDGADAKRTELHSLIDSGSPLSQGAQDQVGQIIGLIDAYDSDFATLKEHASASQKLRQSLVSPTSTSLSDLFFGDTALVEQLGTLQSSITGINKIITGWSARGEAIRGLVDGLELADDLRQWVLEPAKARAQTFVSTQLPDSLEFVKAISEYVTLTAKPSLVGEELERSSPATNWFPLLEPLDTTVDLRRVNWKVGDRVTVIVKIREKPSSPGEIEQPILFQSRYITEAGRTGVVRRIAGNLIFFRPIDRIAPTDEKSWKLNVAAMANWRYYIRDAAGGERFWNWLGLGGGVHLANLNMADKSIEFGVGANISLWNGLVSAGTGWNLSVDNEPQYYLVGVDLINALNRAKGSGKSKTQDAEEESGE